MGKGRVFVIADLHIGHQKCAEWRGFDDSDSFLAELRNNWNNVVSKEDKVYILGDIVWKKQDLWKLNLLNGKKVLVAGNHDIHDVKDYIKPQPSRFVQGLGGLKPFKAPIKNIRGLKELTVLGHTVWLSHAPIHEQAMRDYNDINIHGHLHNKKVLRYIQYDSMLPPDVVEDERYINVCCEHTNNTPVLLEDLIRDRFGSKEPSSGV